MSVNREPMTGSGAILPLTVFTMPKMSRTKMAIEKTVCRRIIMGKRNHRSAESRERTIQPQTARRRRISP